MWSNFKKFMRGWLADDPFTQSGAVAYYAVFSLPGLLIIVMAIASLFFEQQQVEAQVMGHISQILGPKAAENIGNVINETRRGSRDLWAMIVGALTLLFGATGLFIQLQRSLNHIWDVEVKKNISMIEFIKARAAAWGIILAIGFLLLVSLAITATISMLGEWFSERFSAVWLYTVSTLNTVLSFATVIVLFALIYKILPDAFVRWRHALRGGMVAAILFHIGEYALASYFKIAEPQSAFGAAGSIVLLMLWMSYSCLILLIGAEYAKVCAEKSTGRKADPTPIAKRKRHKP